MLPSGHPFRLPIRSYHFWVLSLCMAGLYLLSQYNFLLFHTLVELIAIAVGWCFFLVSWNTRNIAQDDALTFLGLGFLCIGALDLLHTLAYSGMQIIQQPSGANLATQLWLSARLLQAFAFFCYPLLLHRSIRTSLLLLPWLLVTVLLLIAFIFDFFPTCYIEGQGLTSFKRAAEYAICLFFLIDTILLFFRRHLLDRQMFQLIMLSLLLMVCAELTFTFYFSVYSAINASGHLFKILAIYCLFLALIKHALTHPYETLFRFLAQEKHSLEENNTMLTGILTSVTEGIVICNSEKQIIIWNPFMEGISGIPADQALRKDSQTSIDFLKQSGIDINIERALLGEELPSRDFPYQSPVGQQEWGADHTSALKDTKGNITGALVTVRRITDRKLQEQLMAARLQLSQYAMNHSIDDVLRAFLDQAESITHSTMGFFHFVQDEKNSLVLQTWSSTTSDCCTVNLPEAHLPIPELWQHGLRHKRPVIYNDYKKLKFKKGLPEGHLPITRMLLVPMLKENSQTVALIGLANKETDYSQRDIEQIEQLATLAWDIVSKKKAEMEREQLFQAMEQIGEIVFITNTEGSIIYTNPAFVRITNYTIAEAQGHTPQFFSANREEKHLFDEIWQTVRAGTSWQGRLMGRKKDHTEFPQDVVVSPVFAANGKIIQYIFVQRDISEQVKIEEEHRQSQKIEAIGRLAGGIAHDLNNLLSPVLSYSELLRDILPQESKGQKYVENINLAAEKARDLMGQLLTFSRRQPLQYRLLDLNEILTHFSKLLQHTLREDISVDMMLDPNLPLIKADSGQLDQIIMNLAINAQDAMPEGGTLTISTHIREIPATPVSLTPETEPGTYIDLSVQDSGTGMDEHVRRHIFEPFFSTKGSKGTGLGLATVYGIVKQHGGSIAIDSAPTTGTCFHILLPIAEEQHKPTETSVVPHQPTQLPPMTVLIVEDNPMVLNMVHTILRQRGHSVLTADSALKALPLLADTKQQLDLLVTDVIMPEMNGKILAEKAWQQRPELKVLFMSGYTGDTMNTLQGVSQEFPFLRKPFTGSELIKKISEVVGQQAVKNQSDPPVRLS